jgi:hypothetical protein
MCFLTPLPSFPTSFLALGEKSFSNIPSILLSFLDHKNFGDGEQVLSDHNALMNTTSKWQVPQATKDYKREQDHKRGLSCSPKEQFGGDLHNKEAHGL